MSAALRTLAPPDERLAGPLTVPEFIELIRPRPGEERWELIAGRALLMAPQTERHQEIVANLLDNLRPLAAARGCRALPGLGLLSDDVDDYAPIPDIVIRCGQVGESGYAKDPVLVAEVLSPSTMTNDRGRKLDFFQSMPSLQVILVVYQDEVRIEAWFRDGGDWRYQLRQGRTAELDLALFEATLPLDKVYASIPLDE